MWWTLFSVIMQYVGAHIAIMFCEFELTFFPLCGFQWLLIKYEWSSHSHKRYKLHNRLNKWTTYELCKSGPSAVAASHWLISLPSLRTRTYSIRNTWYVPSRGSSARSGSLAGFLLQYLFVAFFLHFCVLLLCQVFFVDDLLGSAIHSYCMPQWIKK